jgi:GUN4-like
LLEGLRKTTIVKDLEQHLAKRVPELHRDYASEKRRKQVPLVIPEPGWKYEEPILSHYVTAVDVVPTPQSTIDAIPLESEKGIDYGKLRDLLEAEKWEEADRETLDIMLEVANRTSEGWLDEDSLEDFSRKVLAMLDQLWVAASKGHFGFSVQKRLWNDCGRPTDSGHDWNSFCVKVGWKHSDANYRYSGGNDYKSWNELKRNLATSPEGELPWLLGEVGGHQVGSRSRLWGNLFMRRSL